MVEAISFTHLARISVIAVNYRLAPEHVYFPPTLLVSGTRDALLSATTMFHRALLRAGRSADLVVFDALPHSHWYALHLPETREAFDIMVRFFNSKLA